MIVMATLNRDVIMVQMAELKRILIIAIKTMELIYFRMNILGIGHQEKQSEFINLKYFLGGEIMYNKYEFENACYIGEKIIFKYKDVSYIIDKIINDNNYLDDKFYLLNESTNNYQYFNNANDLINKGKVEEKYLSQILDNIEIISIDYSTEKEFVSATIMNREIEFEYNEVNYFKSKSDKGYYIWCEKDNSYQYYSSPEELLKKGTLEGKPLRELWEKIHIQFLF